MAYGPVPLIIGVTGHRQPPNECQHRIRETLSQIFKDIRAEFPHTDMILLSPLGEGAERLVAKVAMEQGFRLIAPLPMNREEYEKDFKTTGSREEFSKILSHENVKYFALPTADGTSEDSIRSPGVAREHQYEHAAAYVVRHSQILIALWNGNRGHTSLVMKWQLDGIPKHHVISLSQLDPVESGLVYRVLTSIERDASRSKELLPYTILPERNPAADGQHKKWFIKLSEFLGRWPDEAKHKKYDAAVEYRKTLARIDTFNKECLGLPLDVTKRSEESKSSVIATEDQHSLPDHIKSLLDWYTAADMMSLHYQRLKVHTLNWLFWIAFIAVMSFELYAHLWPNVQILLVGYPVLLISAGVLNYYAKKKGWENKYQDYRALAEGLRVQFFWRLAGIQDSTADHYLHTQRTELDWIRVAIKNLSTITREAKSFVGPAKAVDNVKLVLKYWIGKDGLLPKDRTGQYSYFTNKASFYRDRSNLYDNLVMVFIALSPLIALKLGVLQAWYGTSHPVAHGMILAVALTLVAAALFEGYSQKKAFLELSKRYSWMENLFHNAMKNLDALMTGKDSEEPTPDEIILEKSRELIMELGREALTENGNWLVLHRERPLEVPKA